MGKTITFDLSPRDIDSAIRQLDKYRRDFQKKCDKLLERLAEKGAEVAKLRVVALGKVYTGELQESITGFFDSASRTGIIRAGAWYAVYVEYGTGVVGAGSPHPDPDGWIYDVGGHGDEGWTYYNPRSDRYQHTTGEPSAPFMYQTGKELEKLCQKIAEEVFGS